MKAALLTGPRTIEIGDVPDPRLEHPQDVLLCIDTVGVCGSDMHYYTAGRIGSAVVAYPFVMGHECSATVREAGTQAHGLRVGQRVAIDPLVSCGRCDQCLAGRVHTCRSQRFLGLPGQLSGGLVEYLVLPADCCHPIPDSMTLDQAALVEPLSIGVYAQRLARMEGGAKIAILGSGPIGLSVLLACRAAADCTVYVTDPIAERRRTASRLGSAWVGDPTRDDLVTSILDLEPLGVDLVFECAGEQDTLDQGVALLRPGGTLLVVGIPEADRVGLAIHTMRRKELTIQNVRRQNRCIGPAIDLVASGRVDVDPLMTHHFSLEETGAAFDTVAHYRDGVVKALIHVQRS